MPRTIALRCAHCGAQLDAPEGAPSIVCKFCGTSNAVAAPRPAVPVHTFHAGPQAPTGAVPRSAIGPVVAVGVGIAMAVLVGVIAFASRKGTERPGPVTATRESSPSTRARPTAKHEPVVPAPPPRNVYGDRRLLFFGTGAERAVVLMTGHASPEEYAYTAFTTAASKELWTTDPVGGSRGAVRATLSAGTLFVANDAGQVDGFDLASGKKLFSTTMGERIEEFCKHPAGIAVTLLDRRSIAVDGRTGKQTPMPANARCDEAPADASPSRITDPSDRRDLRGPEGVLGVRCGSVRVMGSRNYVVPDACAGKVPSGAQGMGAHSIFLLPSGTLVLGVRQPGTSSGMVAFAPKGKPLAWKVDVPDGNPLEAQTGSPNELAVLPDRVVVSFRRKGGDHAITAFALQDGARLWTRTLGSGSNVRLTADGATLLLGFDRTLSVLDPATGNAARELRP